MQPLLQDDTFDRFEFDDLNLMRLLASGEFVFFPVVHQDLLAYFSKAEVIGH
jgi:hypothetical protein